MLGNRGTYVTVIWVRVKVLYYQKEHEKWQFDLVVSLLNYNIMYNLSHQK